MKAEIVGVAYYCDKCEPPRGFVTKQQMQKHASNCRPDQNNLNLGN
jgi:hypothetical protein